MNCTNCGNNLLPNAKFCDNCGHQVTGNTYGNPSAKAQPSSGPQNHNSQYREPRKLYRSRKNRMIAGVCGGIGEYYNTDPVLIRLLFFIAFFSGISIFAYLIAILVIPESPYDPWNEPENRY